MRDKRRRIREPEITAALAQAVDRAHQQAQSNAVETRYLSNAENDARELACRHAQIRFQLFRFLADDNLAFALQDEHVLAKP
jgi:hypothetical protein